jgi:hypothetical protein
MSRYDQLIALVNEAKPRIIAEVGTHRAARAVAMCRAALKFHPDVRYIGFDVFETKDAAFHDAAMNGKGIPAKAEAEAALDKIKAEHPGFSYALHVGETSDTLHNKRDVVADLAFIDGDHRLSVILDDYAALAGSVTIALDDYITPGPHGAMPDLNMYGCNRLVDELGFDLLPVKDPCRPGWFAQIAVRR